MSWQEPHVLDAERGGRGDLFAFADGRYVLAVGVVEPALLAVRAQEDRDAQPGVDPAGDRPGRAEVTVVRMRHHHEDALDLIVGSWRGRLAEDPLRHAVSLVGPLTMGPRSSLMMLVRPSRPVRPELRRRVGR